MRYNGISSDSTSDPYNYPSMNLNGKVERQIGGIDSLIGSVKSAFTGSYNSARRVVLGNDSSSRSQIFLLSMSYKSLINFGICLLIGSMFILLSFLFIPIIVIAPEKFILPFSVGCVLWITGLGMLQGPQQLINTILKKEKLPYTLAYIVSLFGVFYSTLIVRSYYLTLLFSVSQILSLSVFIISYLPGGINLLSMIKDYVISKINGRSFLPI